jgi:LPS-assembly lipoprotein
MRSPDSPIMILSLRRLTVAAPVMATLLLGACGFQPVYSVQRNANAAALATIAIAPIEDRMGQQLRTLLRAGLSPKGPADRALYRLTVKLTETKAELALRKDESATRANLTLSAAFVLERLPPYPPGIANGSAISINSYNVLESDYATLSAENDARARALRTLAEEIRLRVATAINNPTVFRIPRPAAGR